MFHPVGSQPSSVYWRRRLVFIGAVVLVIVLLALTISALSGGDGKPTGGGPTARTPATNPVTAPSTAATSSSDDPLPTTAAAGTTTSGSTAPMPVACTLADLQLKALVGKSSYQVGDSPLVELQVTNVGAKPCTRDLADKQIELRVYNGTSRVWGSHDCATQPGTDVRTLAVGQPYRFGILWGGLSSTPSCTQSARQRVGAGSYTLYASLSGKSAAAAQFQIG